MKHLFISIALTVSALSTQPAVLHAADVTTRTECRKESDRGCTAHNAVTIQAPDGMYLIPESLTAGTVLGTNNKGGYKPLCGQAVASGTVPYQLPGTDIIAYLYTSATATLHVESGGGFNDLKQVFYVDCKYSFRTGTIPH